MIRFALGAKLGNECDDFLAAKTSGFSREARAVPQREIPELYRKLRRDDKGIWEMGFLISLPLRNRFIQAKNEICDYRPCG